MEKNENFDNFLIFFEIFDLFLTIFSQLGIDSVPGRPGTEDFVPGFLLLSLSRDKGTSGQGNIFVPGQRDNRTSRPLETLITMWSYKEERSRGTVDWPPKLQTTNLCWLFGLPRGCWIPYNPIFTLCSKKSPNLPCYTISRVLIREPVWGFVHFVLPWSLRSVCNFWIKTGALFSMMSNIWATVFWTIFFNCIPLYLLNKDR